MTVYVSPSGAAIKTCEGTANRSMIQKAGCPAEYLPSGKAHISLDQGDKIFFVNQKHEYRVRFQTAGHKKADIKASSPAKRATDSPAKQQGTLASFMKKRPVGDITSPSSCPQEKRQKKQAVQDQKADSSSKYLPSAAEMDGSGSNIKAASRLAGGGHNLDLCRPFSELAEIYRVMGDTTRHRTYSKAVKGMKQFGKEITSGKEARKIDGLGAKIAAKIDEFLATKARTGTGVVKKVASLMAEEKVKGALELTQVHGIGPKFAQVLIKEHQLCLLEDLHQHIKETDENGTDSKGRKCLLDSTQKLGLRFADEFQQRIPREEVAQIERRLKSIAASVDPQLSVMICGSYRRGNLSSGDVDCLVCHPDHKPRSEKWKVSEQTGAKVPNNRFLQAFVAALSTDGLATDDISHGPTKYMGVIRLPSSSAPTLHRRLDLRVVPWQCYHFSTLYFTGSDDTNVEMRDEAIAQGMTLSEYGLVNTKTKEYVNTTEEFNSERDIFDKLKMAYREPCQR
jgi:DNA polymerase beta